MDWIICFVISFLFVLATLVWTVLGVKNYSVRKIMSPINALIMGVFLAVFVILIPPLCLQLQGEEGFFMKLLSLDIVETLQIFTVNIGSEDILSNLRSAPESLNRAYAIYASIIFTIAPILTFGFIISLFKNALTQVSFWLQYRADTYILSELNEKSLMLAKDLRHNHPSSMIIFTNVNYEEGDELEDLVEGAKELSALLFTKDLLSIHFEQHSKKAEMTFFLIGEESENLVRGLKIISLYRGREHTGVYVFSSGKEGEMLLSNADSGCIKVRRVDEVRSMVYHYLFDHGDEIYEAAKQNRNHINAVVLGFGSCGKEMTKALLWYGQMEGFTQEIHVFDQNETIEDQFEAMCPEIAALSREKREEKEKKEPDNNLDSSYNITLHGGIDVKGGCFARELREISAPTFVFVAMGDDKENTEEAAYVRMLCERAGAKPVIRTVIRHQEKSEVIKGIRNHRGQLYGIEPMGDFETCCSEKVLMGSELEKLALERHLNWGKEEDFWKYEYNYRSSMASAIHFRERVLCGISWAGKSTEEMSDREKDLVEKMEHRRWNAYMRSEGYSYSGSMDKQTRNDLAKVHCDLVSFEILSEEEKRKDRMVGSK